ncbi:MAG: hypothetical protein ACN4GW_19615, partial [Desulforhopalus sp.]
MSNIVPGSPPISATPSPSFFETIKGPQGSYCEHLNPDGSLTPHWKSLLESLGAKGEDELTRNHERAKRMRHEDGATINPYDDLTEQTSSWSLDVVPLPLTSQEWGQIEAGLQQRMGLLEKILRDT